MLLSFYKLTNLLNCAIVKISNKSFHSVVTMKQFTLLALFSVSLFLHTKGQVARLGGCPFVQPFSELNIKEFSGRWHEVFKYSAYFVKGKCISIDVKFFSEKQVAITLNQMLDSEFSNETRIVDIESTAVWTFKIKSIISKSKLVFS